MATTREVPVVRIDAAAIAGPPVPEAPPLDTGPPRNDATLARALAPPTPARPASSLWFWILTATALASGLLSALALAWTHDDAGASFRHASALLRGMGLAFNAGQIVPGDPHVLWTLWCAVGLRGGVAAETWANVTGIACYGATIAGLAGLTWSRRRESASAPAIPIAALALAAHQQANLLATGGLETSLFMLLATAGYFVLTAATASPGRAVSAGLLFGLAALTRLDGLVLAAIAGLWLVWDMRPRLAPAIAFACTLAVFLAPYTIWQLAFPGDRLPQAPYASPTDPAWWMQGSLLLLAYFSKYWVLAVGLVLGLLALGGDRVARVAATQRQEDGTVAVTRHASRRRRQLELALALSLGFTLAAPRLGGDSPFGRLLIPVTPLMLVALEIGLQRLVPARTRRRGLAAIVVLVGVALAPGSLAGGRDVRRIVSASAPAPREQSLAPAETLAHVGQHPAAAPSTPAQPPEEFFGGRLTPMAPLP